MVSDHVKCLLDDDPARILDPATDLSTLTGAVYDLRADPGELRDLWSTSPDLVDECVARYRGELTGPFERYRETGPQLPVRAPFAVGVEDFEVDAADLPLRDIDVDRDPSLTALDGSGWSWLRHRGFFLGEEHRELFASGTHEPLAMEVEIPPGRYRVALGFGGVASVSLQGREPERVVGSELDPTRGVPSKVRNTPCGVVDVPDGRFRAVLQPEPEAGSLLLRHVGFTPVDEHDRPLLAGDRATLPDHLRALGYVEYRGREKPAALLGRISAVDVSRRSRIMPCGCADQGRWARWSGVFVPGADMGWGVIRVAPGGHSSRSSILGGCLRPPLRSRSGHPRGRWSPGAPDR